MVARILKQENPIGLRQIQEAIGRELAACYEIEHQLPDRIAELLRQFDGDAQASDRKGYGRKEQSRPQPFLFGRLIGRSTAD